MLQLTPRLFVRPTNDTIHCTGNDNQFNLAVFSEYAPLQRSEHCPICMQTVGHFHFAENAHAHYFYHVVEVAFFMLVGEEDFLKFSEFNLRWL